ncbi:hypothetical protein [Erwinia sp.]|uniref:hypothetical protein n=1 Tax=Erwinia citreus TaxID=558 RepID=UPI00289B4ACE|nr:hypothetical protein [Erwinia sp.]
MRLTPRRALTRLLPLLLSTFTVSATPPVAVTVTREKVTAPRHYLGRVILSGICMVVLMLCACIALIKRPLAGFNRFINRVRDGYVALTQKMNRYAMTTVGVLLAAGIVTWLSDHQQPNSPQEDESYLFSYAPLPEGVALPESSR